MDFQVIWTDPAIESLGEIVRGIAQDNRTAAQQLGLELVERMEITQQFPRSGPFYRRIDGREIRCLTHGNYRLYYEIIAQSLRVEVLAVRHSARMPPDTL
jgi:plasmid stabilization system protein ParE